MEGVGADRTVLLEIGRIARPHGLGGEVVVSLVTNVQDRLRPGDSVTAAAPGGAGRSRELRVVSVRPHQHRLIVGFEGVASREGAEELRDLVLLAEPAEEPGALYVHELVGKEVVETSGTSHGRVVGLQANPASDLLVGEAGWLVPLRFVVETSGDRIVVEVPEGLFE